MPNFNPFPLDIVNDRNYVAIQNAGVKAAVAQIATQLSTYRFMGAVIRATHQLRHGLLEEILRAQVGNSKAPTLPPASAAENLISDATMVTALTTIRTYLAGVTPTPPPVGALGAKNAFGPFCLVVVECI